MYEAFYNLTGKPFQLSPDPHFHYMSRGHSRAMSYLRYGLDQGEGFIVITGGIGTGKTTLVKALLNELVEDRRLLAAQMLTTQLDPENLVHMVAASFGVQHEGMSKAGIIKNLEAFFVGLSRQGKRALLVVDEVQNLPRESLEELRMLSNLQADQGALLQVFLVGQEEFRQTLDSEGMDQLRQRIIAAYHLSPLDPDETKAYIEHRLTRVGWQGDPEFLPDAVEEIFRYADGVPRKINTFCNRLMLYGYLEDLHQFNRETVLFVADELLRETRPSRPSHERLEAAPTQEQAPRQSGYAARKTANDALSERVAMLELRVEVLEDQLMQIHAGDLSPPGDFSTGMGGGTDKGG
jgi:putative secretion ATPase (PEP-CTERM system associated)